MKPKLYLITLLAFLAIDSIWLGLVAPSFYQSQIGYILAENPNFLAAGLFYLLFVLGMVVFVVEPGVREGTLIKAVRRGALFGLVTYATYDLTNLATLEGWPVLVTVVDLAWGTIL
ncbi:MAG: DUF2177 family protein, partial [Chloroflexi bacterium CFX2]|nr:DUF2177 family protein [Chloroflexi bacterium CFX2]